MFLIYGSDLYFLSSRFSPSFENSSFRRSGLFHPYILAHVAVMTKPSNSRTKRANRSIIRERLLGAADANKAGGDDRGWGM